MHKLKNRLSFCFVPVVQDWDAGELAEAGDGPAEGVLAGGDVGVPGDVVARGLVQVQLLAGLDAHLEQGPAKEES